MRLILCFIFLVIMNLSVIGQDKLIVLHSIVGDTIDQNEQRNFVLFSDILDQNFTFATIHCENSKYRNRPVIGQNRLECKLGGQHKGRFEP